jgi:hypothetical protein
MMLFLAHTLLSTNLDLTNYRHDILTALWCRYGSKMTLEPNDEPIKQLAKWFTLALFGRHATTTEVKAWTERCESWFGEAKTD